ncbi:glycosyltransferase [Catenovulum agarivorans DS-2]|uniref:Glycosyltransferase n=1 Tax=Catenovulum agarivorans DS-2 TaxID=1328313 RepID=W7R0P0_9ALTE|nr:ATP-grasp fold amidoligase family protein [Catenovulum agarivorans]EWH11185.1 glycosyltransferase [Catenovulum agarivorans DS-2]
MLFSQLEWQLFTTSIRFYKKHHYWPNIRQPKTFSEKIQYRKFFQRHPLFEQCADKLAVREYVATMVGETFLVPLLDVVDQVEQLSFADYGDNFVVKANHDSGSVFLCQQGQYDAHKIAKKLAKKLAINSGRKRNEPWYSNIQPKILVEQLLLSSAQQLPEDYKFHVFNRPSGQTFFLQVDFDRHTQHGRCIYDENGQVTDISLHKPSNNKPLPKIENFSEMVEIALKLAKPFDYVRVDLYNLDGQIYFGELTFAHGSGFRKFTPQKYDKLWGNLWQLTANPML